MNRENTEGFLEEGSLSRDERKGRLAAATALVLPSEMNSFPWFSSISPSSISHFLAGRDVSKVSVTKRPAFSPGKRGYLIVLSLLGISEGSSC